MVCVQLKDTRNTQSKWSVDGRCDGDEMSIRDQRVGTSHSDLALHVSDNRERLSNRSRVAALVRWECASTCLPETLDIT